MKKWPRALLRVLLAAVAVAAAGCSSTANTPKATVLEWALTSPGVAQAAGTVRNDGQVDIGKAIIKVRFTDKNGKEIGLGRAEAYGIGPGQTATWKTTKLATSTYAQSCEIYSVDTQR